MAANEDYTFSSLEVKLKEGRLRDAAKGLKRKIEKRRKEEEKKKKVGEDGRKGERGEEKEVRILL